MSQEKKSYSNTLNLPQTEFSLRPEHRSTEAKILSQWDKEDLYAKSQESASGKEKFILHDGPPYANGNIHMGHVLNKVLKDIVARYKRMSGFDVHFRPGWDCHGLPIELKVTKELELDKNARNIDKLTLMSKCRKFAEEWISTQANDFKRLGVSADFKNPYATMSPSYESKIIEVFGKFLGKNLINRRLKTIPWCFSCKTALAAAEIEYKDRKDPSLYVLFELEKTAALSKVFINPNLKVSMLAWTTTPWTLPLNRALLITNTEYSLVKFNDTQAFIAASSLISKILGVTGINGTVIARFDSKELSGVFAHHPINSALKIPIIVDSSVSLEDGTAVVHCAPGCGPEDYLIGQANGLEIYSPVNSEGHYTEGIAPSELDGMHIGKAQAWVVDFLTTSGQLLFKGEISHPYPHCWRCKNGLIFRATKQWFCNLDGSGIKQKTLDQIQKIEFIPEWGKNRLLSFIGGRGEWCISRQRDRKSVV